jgi:hypothetical protein
MKLSAKGISSMQKIRKLSIRNFDMFSDNLLNIFIEK